MLQLQHYKRVFIVLYLQNTHSQIQSSEEIIHSGVAITQTNSWELQGKESTVIRMHFLQHTNQFLQLKLHL